jgi:hypothetical protein
MEAGPRKKTQAGEQASKTASAAPSQARPVDRAERDFRELLHALSDAVADHLAHAGHSDEYYDQESSPLPAHIHTLLVRTGALPGFKVARRVLVRRDDMHAYIAQHKVEPNVRRTTPDSEAIAIEQLLERAGVRRAG